MQNIEPQRIRNLRKRRGLSQSQLASLLGISDRAVSKWEKGYSQPSANHLIALAQIFGVNMNAFLSEERADGTLKAERTRGMESLTELFKIGRGPSSSHTMGPERACREFIKRNPEAEEFEVVLYGSLAKTGRGHGTDKVIEKTFAPSLCKVIFNLTDTDIPHPNTMDIIGIKNGIEIKRSRVMSVGGGSVLFEDENGRDVSHINYVYKECTFIDIASYCKENGMRLWQYVEKKRRGRILELYGRSVECHEEFYFERP